MTQAQALVDSVNRSDEKSKETKEMLEMLMALAHTKADLFSQKMEMELQNTSSDGYHKLPITRIISQKRFIHAETQDSIDAGKAIKDGLGDVLDPIPDKAQDDEKEASWKEIAKHSIDGVEKVVSKGVSMFLGSKMGMEEIDQGMECAMDGLGLVRLDYFGWKRTIVAEGLSTVMQSIIVYCVTKSAIDFSKLSFNDFVIHYMPMLMSMVKEEDQPMHALLKAKEVYELLGGKEVPTVKPSMTMTPKQVIAQPHIENMDAVITRYQSLRDTIYR